MPIDVDKASLARAYASLAHIKNGAPRAMVRALNKGATVSRTEASRRIREDVRLPAAYVNSRLTVRKATFDKQSSAVVAPSRGLLMSYFLVQSATQPLAKYDAKAGRMVIKKPANPVLKTKIKPGGPVHIWERGVFLITFPNGVVGMVRRTGPGRGGLKVLYGPSLSQVYNREKDEIADPLGANTVAVELDRQIQLIFDTAP